MLGALLAMPLFIATACGYSPNPESGTLQCGSSNTCPEGYSCRSGLCWKGGGGNGDVTNFIGTWVFDGSASKRVRQCDDGTNETLMPWDDFVTIDAGAAAALSIGYYCSWDADVNGTKTVIRSDQFCEDEIMLPGTKFTYYGESFALTTTNGATGTLEASIPYDYSSVAGSGSCTMKFTGTVTKN
jgi:hypothetical protein